MVKKIFNKKASRGMAVLMAAALVGTMSPVSIPTQPVWTVEAAATTQTVAKDAADLTVVVDYTGEQFKVTPGENVDMFYYAVATVKKDIKDTDVKFYPKASAYESVEAKEATDVDMSWANLTKENTYLFVTTDTDVTKVKPVVVPLGKQTTKLKFSVAGKAEKSETDAFTAIGDADNGYIKLASDEKKNPDKVTFKDLQYKTENGQWQNVYAESECKLSLARYATKGATIQFRVAAAEDDLSTKEVNEGRPAGKAVKVKIPAKAKGPKLTVNYLDQTVKFAKGAEFKVGDAKDWTAVAEADTKTGKTFTVLKYDGEKPLIIRTRVAGTDKKASSKVTTIKLPVAKEAPKATVASKTSQKPDETSGQISIDYATPYSVDSGIVLTNYSNKALQFAVVKKEVTKTVIAEEATSAIVEQANVDGIGIADKKKVAWVNVAASPLGDDGKIATGKKPATGKITKIDGKKISEIKAADYQIIYRLGDKKATDISKITVVNLPVALEQTITAKDGETAVDSSKPAELTAGGTKDVTVEIADKKQVSDKSKWTVKAYKAKAKDSNAYGDKDAATTDISGAVASGKLTIKSKAAAQGKYVLEVTCEGASILVPVHVFKATSEKITLSNEVKSISSATAAFDATIDSKDKKAVVITAKAKTDVVTITIKVADPTESKPDQTKDVQKKITVDEDGNIKVEDATA